MNWVEQLASDRAAELDFGALGSWAYPRSQGCAHDWARAGRLALARRRRTLRT